MINLDFAGETVMSASGKAMMGTGEAEGENRAMAATELALNNPLIDEYTLQGAKGLLINITGGSDLTLFEVDAAVNKIRAEVDPEAELIFGAIKDENMDGKIRVSIVATCLKGSAILQEGKPILNVVSGTNNRINNIKDNLFSNPIEKNVVNSIEGATALKLDESFEVKNSEEQNAQIDSFENNEEKFISNQDFSNNNLINDIPTGVSIESASYMENYSNIKTEETDGHISENTNYENTPKLFTEENSQENSEINDLPNESGKETLFDQDQDNEDEDLKFPLKKTKVLMRKSKINDH